MFARGHSTLGQSPFVRPSRLQVPLTIKVQEEVSEWPSVTVEPGDIILADEDGVVCIPLDKVEQVVGLAQKGKGRPIPPPLFTSSQHCLFHRY